MQTKCLKVLHIIDSGGLYGAEVMLLNLIGEQIKLGLSPTICSIGEKGIAEKALEAEAVHRNFSVKTFRMRPGFNLKGIFEILRFAEKGGFSILHSHGYKGNILLGFIPKRYRKLPLVTTLHGWANTGSAFKMRLYEWIDGRALKYIDAVVAVNGKMLANPMLKKGGINLYVVNNGIPIIETKITGELDSEVEVFCKEGFIIGAVGRLSHEKGFNYLIDAIACVRKIRKDAKLLIIGDGPERYRLTELAHSLGLKEVIFMPGYKAYASRYIRFFDLFVLPSLTEGLPMVILESMQCGVPIVATRVGGVPEVLEEGSAGVLIEPASSKAIAEAILAFGGSTHASSLGKKAKEIVNSKYSSESMAAGYHTIYIDLLRQQTS